MNHHYIIVTASYNRPELLKRNIEAMLHQAYPYWQQIIVDDGSSADMRQVLALAQQDARITVIHNTENRGCNATRNTALDHIHEQQWQGFVSFVDDDDFLLPGALHDINGLINQMPGYLWYTGDCCYPDGQKASRLARHGKLSYLYDYMFGKDIKGDLNHFIDSRICTGIRFTDRFRNGQEWSFYSQLSATNTFYAFEKNIKVVEYLTDGLTRQNVNSQNRLDVFQLKVAILAPLVSSKLLSGQQLLLARELLSNSRYLETLALLKSIARYQYLNIRFYRYFCKALVSSLAKKEEAANE